MKRLILMRHAKSSWEDDLADFDRPLNRRGLRDAPRIAAELVRLDWIPDLVIYSAALRTTQTWQLMAEYFANSPQAVSSRHLYLSSTAALRQTIENLSENVTTALLLGHNPVWESMVSQLSRQNVRLTTANAALFQTDTQINWQDTFASTTSWELMRVLKPKELSDAAGG